MSSIHHPHHNTFLTLEYNSEWQMRWSSLAVVDAKDSTLPTKSNNKRIRHDSIFDRRPCQRVLRVKLQIVKRRRWCTMWLKFIIVVRCGAEHSECFVIISLCFYARHVFSLLHQKLSGNVKKNSLNLKLVCGEWREKEEKRWKLTPHSMSLVCSAAEHLNLHATLLLSLPPVSEK